MKMGPETCQNKDADVAASGTHHKHQKRYFSKTLLKWKLANGCFIPHQKALFFVSHVDYLGTVIFSLYSVLTSGYSDCKMQLRTLLNMKDRRATERPWFLVLRAVLMLGI